MAMKSDIAVFAACCLLAGCEQHPRYYIGVVNKTGRDITSVQVVFSDKAMASPGVLVQGSRATQGPLTEDIPSQAQVRWTDSRPREVKANLQGVVSARFTDGTIYFIIRTNGAVEVKTAKLDDVKANAEITR